MSVQVGNDPFSQSDDKNIIKHIISPKIVSDGSFGYTVKTDLINVDNSYQKNSYFKTDTGTVAGQIGAYPASFNINTPSQLRFGKIDNQFSNTQLDVSNFGSKQDKLIVGGTIESTSGIYANNYLTPTNGGIGTGIGTVTPINIQESISGTTGTALIQAGPSLGTSSGSTNGIARVAFTTDTNSNQTSIQLQPNNGSSPNTVLNVESFGVISSKYIQTNLGTSVSGMQHYNFSTTGGDVRASLGLNNVETGSGNTGSDVYLYLYNDAGIFITTGFKITRATGNIETPGGLIGKSKGTLTLVGGTATVADTTVTADSDILITLKTLGGTGTGQVYVSAKVASTSFTVSSAAGAGDTSTFNYIIFN
jgi:hypothetical protein